MVSYRNYLFICAKKKRVLTQLKIVKKLKLCTLQLLLNTTLAFTNNITYLACSYKIEPLVSS